MRGARARQCRGKQRCCPPSLRVQVKAAARRWKQLQVEEAPLLPLPPLPPPPPPPPFACAWSFLVFVTSRLAFISFTSLAFSVYSLRSTSSACETQSEGGGAAASEQQDREAHRQMNSGIKGVGEAACYVHSLRSTSRAWSTAGKGAAGLHHQQQRAVLQQQHAGGSMPGEGREAACCAHSVRSTSRACGVQNVARQGSVAQCGCTLSDAAAESAGRHAQLARHLQGLCNQKPSSNAASSVPQQQRRRVAVAGTATPTAQAAAAPAAAIPQC